MLMKIDNEWNYIQTTTTQIHTHTAAAVYCRFEGYVYRFVIR